MKLNKTSVKIALLDDKSVPVLSRVGKSRKEEINRKSTTDSHFVKRREREKVIF